MSKPSEIYISFSPEAIEIRKRSSGETVEIRWDAITRIVAYKRDLFAYDMICVAFEVQDNESIEIDETMDGFLEAMEQASAMCAGCLKLDAWYQKIMVPAFVTNMTELYHK